MKIIFIIFHFILKANSYKISFDDPDRPYMGSAGTWHSMSSVTAGPGESAKSFFEFGEGSQGNYGIVNVNVNYANHEILICDRIGLVIPGTDIEPPSVPPNLSAVQTPVISGCRISLSWDESSGSAGVGYYEIFRDGTFLAEVSDTEYSDPVLPGSSYTYTLRACDVAGNCSVQSSPVSVTVSSAEENRTGTVRYLYDDLNRLTNVGYDSSDGAEVMQITFTYDKTGNRKSEEILRVSE